VQNSEKALGGFLDVAAGQSRIGPSVAPDVVTVSKAPGHSNPHITFTVYAHAIRPPWPDRIHL